MNEKRALIVVLGFKPRPVLFSIENHKPEMIGIFCSKDSVQKLEADVLKQLNPPMEKSRYLIGITNDHEDLRECFDTARKLVRDLIKDGYNNREILIDYTCGTKNMTAALTLVAALYGVDFTYVAGERRTKDGLGIVQDGHEVIKDSGNPWYYLGINEKNLIKTLINNYQYSAACLLIDNTIDKVDEKTRLFLLTLKDVLTGFDLWDHFKYKEAATKLNKEKLSYFLDIVSITEPEYKPFVKNCQDAWIKLKEINETIENQPGKKDEKTKNLPVFYDIVSNAERRKESGNYDDGILRLYRALEMFAQIQLRGYDINDSDVKLNNSLFNEEVSEWLKEQKGEKKKIQLALFNKYNLLIKLNDEVGKEFAKKEKEFRKITERRNLSFLAHGVRILGKSDYDKFYSQLKEFAKIDEDVNLNRFPKMIR